MFPQQVFLDKDGYVNYQLEDQNNQKIEDKVRNSMAIQLSSLCVILFCFSMSELNL